MRRLTILAVAAFLIALVGTARAADQQQPARITLAVQDADVRTLLLSIAKDAGLNLVVSQDVRGFVTVTLKDMLPEEALKAVASAAGGRLLKDGDVYVVDRKPPPPERQLAPAGPAPGARATVVAPAGRAGASSGQITAQEREIIRVIQLRYADPAMIAMALGGGIIGGYRGGFGGGGYGQSGYGGYGGQGGYGGSGGFGGSRGGYGGSRSGLGSFGGGF